MAVWPNDPGLTTTTTYGHSPYIIHITNSTNSTGSNVIYTIPVGYEYLEPEYPYSLEPKTPPGTRPACWRRPEFRRPARVCMPRVPEAVRWRLYARRCLGATPVRPVAPVARGRITQCITNQGSPGTKQRACAKVTSGGASKAS